MAGKTAAPCGDKLGEDRASLIKAANWTPPHRRTVIQPNKYKPITFICVHIARPCVCLHAPVCQKKMKLCECVSGTSVPTWKSSLLSPHPLHMSTGKEIQEEGNERRVAPRRLRIRSSRFRRHTRFGVLPDDRGGGRFFSMFPFQ